MAPATMKQWVVEALDRDLDGLVYKEAPVPQVGDYDVLIKLHAASLNFRDLAITKGFYPFPVNIPVVAGSDGAGEVVEVGSKVSRWAKGDKVVTLFNQGHQYGDIDMAAAGTGLGGCIDGTLRQYAVYHENGVVRQPANLNALEAATLTCAGLTAWNALYGLKPLKPGQTVLVQGTGGVSLFALQFAKAAGARVIATTSSAAKVEIMKKLGADHVINYNEDANWGATARKLTPGGVGVDHVVEIGGASTMAQTLAAIKLEGVVSVIGFVGGAEPRENVLQALHRACIFRGVLIGPRNMMEDMCAAVEVNDIHPVVDDKVFGLDELKEAYQFMWSRSHIGKLAIKID